MLQSVMIDTAAELLGVSRRTVYYRIREGKLQTIRTPCNSQRVLVESLYALMGRDAGRLLLVKSRIDCQDVRNARP